MFSVFPCIFCLVVLHGEGAVLLDLAVVCTCLVLSPPWKFSVCRSQLVSTFLCRLPRFFHGDFCIPYAYGCLSFCGTSRAAVLALSGTMFKVCWSIFLVRLVVHGQCPFPYGGFFSPFLDILACVVFWWFSSWFLVSPYWVLLSGVPVPVHLRSSWDLCLFFHPPTSSTWY